MRNSSIGRSGVLSALMLFGIGAGSAHAEHPLFAEDFEGYTEFTRTNLSVGSPYNPGVPLASEGAQGTWYGAYFETPNMSGDVVEDMGVQSPPWYALEESNTARFSNNAGLLFKVDTTNFTGASLRFDVHTYEAMAGDHFRAGYYAGSLPGGCEDGGETDCVFDFSGSPASWSSWTEQVSGLFPESPEHGDQAMTFPLPGGVSELWIAFWMHSDEASGVCPYYNCGLGKIDNVTVQHLDAVPLPAAVWLLGSAMVGMGFATRRSRTERESRMQGLSDRSRQSEAA